MASNWCSPLACRASFRKTRTFLPTGNMAAAQSTAAPFSRWDTGRVWLFRVLRPLLASVWAGATRPGLFRNAPWGVGDGIVATPEGLGIRRCLRLFPQFIRGLYQRSVGLHFDARFRVYDQRRPEPYHQWLGALPASSSVKVHRSDDDRKFHCDSYGGLRPLVTGEMIWSDAFPVGSTVAIVDGNTFPQTITMADYTDVSGNQNATVTHGSGSPGQMWIIPGGLKRDTTARSNNNSFLSSPSG